VSKSLDILVIDDEQVVREGVCRICETGGLTIEAVGDAASGLEKLQKNTYRLVLCDVMLPDHDGFHILHSLNKTRNQPPVIMITGCSTLQNAVNALKDGALDFIPKPFTVDELESAIQRGLQFQKLLETMSGSGTGDKKVWEVARPCPKESYRLGMLSWVRIEKDGTGLVGVTDLFMKTVTKVNVLQFADMNRELVQAALCVTLTTKDKLIHQVLSPLSGGVVRRNEELLSHPELVEQDPYGAGWLYQIVPTNLAFELNHLTPCTHDC
jgi:DNA-binding response OmpR family regulator